MNAELRERARLSGLEPLIEASTTGFCGFLICLREGIHQFTYKSAIAFTCSFSLSCLTLKERGDAVRSKGEGSTENAGKDRLKR
jgi:hypothetical protein